MSIWDMRIGEEMVVLGVRSQKLLCKQINSLKNFRSCIRTSYTLFLHIPGLTDFIMGAPGEKTGAGQMLEPSWIIRSMEKSKFESSVFGSLTRSTRCIAIGLRCADEYNWAPTAMPQGLGVSRRETPELPGAGKAGCWHDRIMRFLKY